MKLSKDEARSLAKKMIEHGNKYGFTKKKKKKK